MGAALSPDSVTLGNVDDVLRNMSITTSSSYDSNTTTTSRTSATSLTPPISVAIVLGNEGSGLRTNILKRCDVLVKIGAGTSATTSTSNNNNNSSSSDINGEDTVDSLNVGVAGGILLHHFLGK